MGYTFHGKSIVDCNRCSNRLPFQILGRYDIGVRHRQEQQHGAASHPVKLHKPDFTPVGDDLRGLFTPEIN